MVCFRSEAAGETRTKDEGGRERYLQNCTEKNKQMIIMLQSLKIWIHRVLKIQDVVLSPEFGQLSTSS